MKDDSIKSEEEEEGKRTREREREIMRRDAAFVERRVIPLQLVTRDRGLIRVQIGKN